MRERYKLWKKPELASSSLVVGWNRDVSRLGARVTDYLNRSPGSQCFAEIEPAEFFPLGGVTVENDVAQFPEGKFYFNPHHALVVFISDPPSYNWYEFFNLILDIAQQYCRVVEVYAIGGLVAASAHTTPRGLLATFSSPEFKTALSHYHLSADLDYETPPDQRPTLNSFLSWTARKRGLPAVSLWAPVPFYLLSVGDPQAQRRVIEFLDQRFDLGIDFSDLNAETQKQYEQLARLRNDFPEVDALMGRLESNLVLSREENEKLAQKVREYLPGNGVRL